MYGRVALAAVVASPAAAALAGRCLTAQSLSHRAGELNEDVGSSVGSETQLARSHVASLVCIVDTSAEACWLAVSEEEKLHPAQYQALLDTFAFEVLFCQDKPTGLRQVQHLHTNLVSAAAVYLLLPLICVFRLVMGLACHVRRETRLHVESFTHMLLCL